MSALCNTFAVILLCCSTVALLTEQPAWAIAGALLAMAWAVIGRLLSLPRPPSSPRPPHE
jgi:hypothetical protein